MAKSIIYWLMPEDMTLQSFQDADGKLEDWLIDLDVRFAPSFRMPGTRVYEEWQMVNMSSIKPEDKNNMFVAIMQRAADAGWDVRKLPPTLNINAVEAQLRSAPPKTLFFSMWHHPVKVVQYRENGTPVMVGTGEDAVPKKVHPVYDVIPDWFIYWLEDVVVGGTPENPVMGRPTEVPQLNKWVHQDSFAGADLAEEVDETVPDNTPDE